MGKKIRHLIYTRHFLLLESEFSEFNNFQNEKSSEFLLTYIDFQVDNLTYQT